MMAGHTITVEIISDVVCPWCYVGKRRFAGAMELVPEFDISVRWRPFRLDPTIPREGIAREAYLSNKFGSVEAIGPMHRKLAEMGAAEGVDFRFDRIARSPNTVDAHRLIRWARVEGVEDAMVERLFRAYFTDGDDIGAPDVLADIAAAAGLAVESVAERLASDEDRAAVEAEINEAYRIGVSAVPCFIIDQTYAVMGAQAPETIAAAIRQTAEQQATAEA
jgi:predicted DsbA family dithiol-disulfide isomerase